MTEQPPIDPALLRPGGRLVLVRDDETTTRTALIFVPDGEPDPEPVVDDPEDVARRRQMAQRLADGTLDVQPDSRPAQPPDEKEEA